MSQVSGVGGTVTSSAVHGAVNEHYDQKDRYFDGIQMAQGNPMNNRFAPQELAKVTNLLQDDVCEHKRIRLMCDLCTSRERKTGIHTALDFTARVPINMLLEPDLYKKSVNPELQYKLNNLTTLIADQQDTVVMLSENQRRMNELRRSAMVFSPLFK